MKAGDVVEWLDQGPAILLEEVEVAAPLGEEHLAEFLKDPTNWPTEKGWKIKLLLTQEILDVHIDTINSDFNFNPQGVIYDTD
jgi:hypothetical protein